MDFKKNPLTSNTQSQQFSRHHHKSSYTSQITPVSSISSANTNTKTIQVYEMLNKIQNVLNTDTVIPQFIQFAKNMEEVRKKWLQSELDRKEIEKRLYQTKLEKSTLQRQINELKIDIEIHHEKRQQAENERDKLQKQIELFKEILNDKSKYSSVSDEERNMIFSYNSNFNGVNNNHNDGLTNGADSHPNHLRQQTSNILNNQYSCPRNDIQHRRSVNGIEDTGSIISDYTEDDIDLPDDDNLPCDNMNINAPYYLNSNINALEKDMNQRVNRHLDEITDQNNKENESTRHKRNGHQRTNSISKAIEQSGQDKKRVRTHSIDINQDTNNGQERNSRNCAARSSITSITTLKISEDGGPITITSEIQHNDQEIITKKEQRCQMDANSNRMEVQFSTKDAGKGRKKRPSREFLQRNADESISTEDSEVFWNGSEAVVAEVTADCMRSNQHMPMTPIVEMPSPSKSSANYNSSVHHSRTRHKQTLSVGKSTIPTTPVHNPLKALISANSMPLARKYKKPHAFKGQVLLNSELCAHCDKRTKFGKFAMKCKECDMIVHTECKDLLQRSCFSMCNFPAQGSIGDYICQTDSSDSSPKIPPILQMIINEIEVRGLATQEVGLYRVNGSDTQIKQLRERLIKRNHGAPDLRKIHDIHVLCSFVKDFLNHLSEHLITYESWIRFAKASEIQNETERLSAIQQAVEDLPIPNRDTLAFMILHLQRIADTPECKMPISNLARVFGPSIVGNSAPNMAPAEIINELQIQHQVVESLIRLPSAFYSAFVDGVDQQQLLFKNPPKTPEVMRKSKTAVVLSSILGPASNNIPSTPKANYQPSQVTLQQSHSKTQHKL